LGKECWKSDFSRLDHIALRVLRHGRIVFNEATGDIRAYTAEKAEEHQEHRRTVVAMDCPGCVMQIRGEMDQDGADVKVRHTEELLAEQLKD
jgi:Fe-S oxidoreductase